MINHFDFKKKKKQEYIYLWEDVGWTSCIIILYEIWSVLTLTSNNANGMKNKMSYTFYTLIMCSRNILTDISMQMVSFRH